MSEYGLFSDEGCVEAGFYSREEAEGALRERYSPDDKLTIQTVCEIHSEQPARSCEGCGWG